MLSMFLESLLCTQNAVTASDNNGGGGIYIQERHAYSLTTFDPNGKLTQVEHALLAASMGTPIVACVDDNTNSILLAAPQLLPSPFLADDGTPRFAIIAPNWVVGHSGIAADGRVVMEAARRLVIEHTFTFDEPMPPSLFLEELSLLFQEYTMRQMARPFGCTLVLGYLPSGEGETPRLFRIDCSGAVMEIGKEEGDDGIFVLGASLQEDAILRSKLRDLISNNAEDTKNAYSLTTQMARRSLSRILNDAMERLNNKSSLTSPASSSTKKKSTSSDGNSDESNGGDIDDALDEVAMINDKLPLPLRIISASFNREEGLMMERRLAA